MSYAVSAAGSSFEFNSTQGARNAIAKIDDTHYLNIFRGPDNDGFAQVFEVDEGDWSISASGSAFEFDTANLHSASIMQVDSNHFLIFYGGASNAAYAEVLEVNLSTWAVTSPSARLDVGSGMEEACNAIAQVDSNHFLLTWADSGFDTNATIVAVNLSTWAVTKPASDYEITDFTTDGAGAQRCVIQVDSTHFLVVVSPNNGNAMWCQILDVNTGTWAVTAAGSMFVLNAGDGGRSDIAQIDSTHFILAYSLDAAGGGDGFAVVLAVNTGTWAITAAGSVVEYAPSDGRYVAIETVDSEHFIVCYSGSGSDGFAEVIEVDTGDWSISTTDTPLEFDTSNNFFNAIAEIESPRYIVAWQGGAGGSAGYAIVLEVAVAVEQTQTVQARARIKVTQAGTIQARARVANFVNQTVQARARIKVLSQSAVVSAKALIVYTMDSTISARARIKDTQSQTIQVKARMMVSGQSGTVQSKARILVVQTKTVSAMARILKVQSRTISAKAYLWAARLGVTVGVRGSYGQHGVRSESRIQHGKRLVKSG